MSRVWATNQVERSLRKQGHVIIAGADEVGRGALAGPITVAVAVLPEHIRLRVCDSKMINRETRESLATSIAEYATAVGYGWSYPDEIDTLGVTESLRLCYLRALEDLDLPISWLVLDGNYNFLEDFEIATPLVRADQHCKSVAAASILAKVARDRYMINQAIEFPEYSFDTHVGYGTLSHRKALSALGPSPIHRRSFKLKALLT